MSRTTAALVSTAAALGAAFLITSCAQPLKMAWQHYDECAAQSPPFAAMVACGKQRRGAYCAEQKVCSADGDALVRYADSLVQSINRHEMTEAEAERRWIEFRTARVDQDRQLAAQAAAAAAASAPVPAAPRTCIQNGPVTSCF